MNVLKTDDTTARITRLCLLALAFLGMALGVFLLLFGDNGAIGEQWHKGVYLVGTALLLAALFTRWLSTLREGDVTRPHGVWYCPLVAAGLTLVVALLAYANLGIWPLGEKTVMVVDMHLQIQMFLLLMIFTQNLPKNPNESEFRSKK